jgi:hypothetical protein
VVQSYNNNAIHNVTVTNKFRQATSQ